MVATKFFLAALSAGMVVLAVPGVAQAASPTTGLTQYTDSYNVQHPYDLNTSDRFSVTSGPQYNAWIYPGDKPHTPTSNTGPRTEMRWRTNWSAGRHQWSGDLLVDSGTDGTCVFQVKGASGGEPIYLNVHSGGNLYNSTSGTVLASAIWGKWIHLNAEYNPSTGRKAVWINGVLVLGSVAPPNENVTTVGAENYFKNGVYGIKSGTKAEAHFKNITFWKS